MESAGNRGVWGEGGMLKRLFYGGPPIGVLHEQYAKKGRVDDEAPMKASYEVLIEAPVERVWGLLSDVPGWGNWYPDVHDVRLDSGVEADARFDWRNGKACIKSKFAVVDAEREIAWTGVSSGAKAVHRHVLEPAGPGVTRVFSEESMAGPLLAAVALPVLFAVFGTILVGGSGLEWYEQLKKPRFVVPLGIFYLVGALYYVLFAIVLYRVLSRVGDARGRAISLALALGVMLFNELWNYAFFGLRSTLAGFLGIVVFVALLTALVAALGRYERFSAVLVVPYYLWVLLYDLAWTYELWRLN